MCFGIVVVCSDFVGSQSLQLDWAGSVGEEGPAIPELLLSGGHGGNALRCLLARSCVFCEGGDKQVAQSWVCHNHSLNNRVGRI